MAYIMLGFTDGNLFLEENKFEFDISFLVCIGGNLAVHLFLLLKSSIISTATKLKKKCGKKAEQTEKSPNKKAKKYVEP